MEGHISPVSSADEAEIAAILQEELEYDEVDINIHFHCEHCFKISKCRERPKAGFSCEIIDCPFFCGHKFHACKLAEHKLLCLNAKVPCLNAGFGCPHLLQRHAIPHHLPQCPASVVVCSCERNRWLACSKRREAVAPYQGHMLNFEPSDIDVSLALNDQALLNKAIKARAETSVSGASLRLPLLPLHSPLMGLLSSPASASEGRCYRSPSLATDEEELVPGLSGSVCAQLQGRCLNESKSTDAAHKCGTIDDEPSVMRGVLGVAPQDNYFRHACSHGVHRTLCHLCRNDAPPPRVQMKNVWREQWFCQSDGTFASRWIRQQRVAKVRKHGPLDTIVFCRVEDSDEDNIAEETTNSDPDRKVPRKHSIQQTISSSLTPGDLKLGLSIENYSKHQAKPRSMITVQCLQVLRRDEFVQHYSAVHCGIMAEGIEGRQLLRRCPLYARGCPFSDVYLAAGRQMGCVSFSRDLQAFGLKPHLDHEPQLSSNNVEIVDGEKDDKALPFVSSSLIMPSPLALHSLLPSSASSHCNSLMASAPSTRETSPCPPAVLYRAAPRLTMLPSEVLQHILSYLDGYSLSQLSLTCTTLASACAGVVRERGVVVMFWQRVSADVNEPRANSDDGDVKCTSQRQTKWALSKPRWMFSSSFGSIDGWYPKENVSSLANHLMKCPYNDRNIPTEKFSYGFLPKKKQLTLKS